MNENTARIKIEEITKIAIARFDECERKIKATLDEHMSAREVWNEAINVYALDETKAEDELAAKALYFETREAYWKAIEAKELAKIEADDQIRAVKRDLAIALQIERAEARGPRKIAHYRTTGSVYGARY